MLVHTGPLSLFEVGYGGAVSMFWQYRYRGLGVLLSRLPHFFQHVWLHVIKCDGKLTTVSLLPFGAASRGCNFK